ncbi:Gfo/Idh/MocA family protein [Streptomyces hygroscopicus]|uniref:Gfo/Idh/MocA family protein n=1 Tax=Streptomyces hygroscopicus TaxID=1912 RepID=UPI000A487C10|nr:Gfo/Idh/MocA family oxidoreductase [Streptomyces hygroscopicus]
MNPAGKQGPAPAPDAQPSQAPRRLPRAPRLPQSSGPSRPPRPVSFGLVGSGWRAEFYLRIAHALPDRFQVAGVVARRPQRRAELHRTWSVPVFASLEELLAAGRPDFIVTALPRTVNAHTVAELARRGVPVLSETPPAAGLEEMTALVDAVGDAVVEVAEQYQYLPTYEAALQAASRGILGEVTSAQVSVAQTYHAISLLRRFLGVGMADATVTAVEFTSELAHGPGRDGWQREGTTTARQTIATLHFGDRLGLYDFTSGQWFHPLLGRRLVVRGQRGELIDDRVTCLHTPRTPSLLRFERHQTGTGADLGGFHLEGISLGPDRLYHNPYAPARLADEEIAIATCLSRMADRLAGDPGPYPLAEACQDHYLGLAVEEVARTGRQVTTVRQPWALTRRG